MLFVGITQNGWHVHIYSFAEAWPWMLCSAGLSASEPLPTKRIYPDTQLCELPSCFVLLQSNATLEELLCLRKSTDLALLKPWPKHSSPQTLHPHETIQLTTNRNITACAVWITQLSFFCPLDTWTGKRCIPRQRPSLIFLFIPVPIIKPRINGNC